MTLTQRPAQEKWFWCNAHSVAHTGTCPNQSPFCADVGPFSSKEMAEGWRDDDSGDNVEPVPFWQSGDIDAERACKPPAGHLYDKHGREYELISWQPKLHCQEYATVTIEARILLPERQT